MSGPSHGEPRSLSAVLIKRYRQLLMAHAHDPATDGCRLCRNPRCHAWLFAYQQLVSAGQLEGTMLTQARPGNGQS
jgi:hypothetical protein